MTLNSSIFRAYDIRGTYPDQIDAETARLIAKGYITFLLQSLETKIPTIVVGKDNRTSGAELQEAFIAGLMEHGAQVLRVEDSPSPMLYHAVCHGHFDGGVNITASHNPAEYNGFKLLAAQAHSIAGEDIQSILKIIQNEDFADVSPGTVQDHQITEDYYQAITEIITLERPLKVVVDAGNAIAGKYYPELFRRLGCEVTELFCEQDGSFPNHQPDPIVEENTEHLKKAVLAYEADLGIAFDGDGDRCGLIDNKGHFHDANETFYLLIKDILPRHHAASVVYTVSNSLIIPELIRELGGDPMMVPVGHSYVEHAMSDTGAPLGGEQSGHFFIAEEYFGYDDAAYTAAKLCQFFTGQDKTVAEHYELVPKTFSPPEQRIHCPDEKKFEVVESMTKALVAAYDQVETMDGVRVEWEDGSWLGIRASNTSPKLSILMEAKSEERLKELQNQAKALLEAHT